ncbi:MAG: excinuclease ABC subunit UvrA [Candidatus Omnitrophica bacterium]|nr:excinuclease ABC subunit UvrA [Candidatus Omnitrophota bacterium]
MKSKHITIRQAREHNLKNLDLKIPRDQFVVITGLSGSGKSSLAFDTIYAEGQRRYVESLSAYARQFLEQLQKPDVESIEGLSPTISIEQKTTSRNPRSTVATQTEISDYLRLLYASIGVPHDPKTGKPIEKQSAQEIVSQVMALPEGTRIIILAPLIKGKKGEYKNIPKQVAQAGFARIRVDGNIQDVQEELKLDKYKMHTIEVVVDRIALKDSVKKRLTDSIETALEVGQGSVTVLQPDAESEKTYSEKFSSESGFNIDEVTPRLFSFNSPYGACESCNGLGTKMEIDPELLVPDGDKPWINAIAPRTRGRSHYLMYYRAVMRELAHMHDVDPYQPFKKTSRSFMKKIFYGTSDSIWGKPFEGVIPYLERMFQNTDSDWLKDEISRFMSVLPCPACNGSRMRPEALAFKINGLNIAEVNHFSIKDAKKFFAEVKLNKAEGEISEQIIKEINRRLDFCFNVGLDYLTLDRMSATLSGGEAERIRLATQVGSGLTGVIYILDEPSIGLHQKDNQRLLTTLHSLRDIGNTLIVVEHDEETIRKSDYIVDLGPGAGEYGGEIIYAGKTAGILKSKKSLTGQYLNGKRFIPVPAERRPLDPKRVLTVKGAEENNLKNIDVTIPLGTLTCVTGVSGSGKSTLVNEILYKALAKELHHAKDKPGRHKRITGLQQVDKIIEVDQSPIGRTPRSNPATYTGVFSHIRSLFSQLPDAKMRGYKPGRFSFNVKGGRCEACQGDGIRKIEMHFLPDVYVECEVCKGKRFNEQTLEIQFKGYSICDILNLAVTEAIQLFENIPPIRSVLTTLNDVGLGYIRLGQQATTLSGGEAQRVKLASELRKQSTGNTLYILDEPTTGLHFADVDKLLKVLQRLVEKGNTILVIEHNLDIIKTADYIIDLGPDGGDKGGEVVFAGPPEQLAEHPTSHTAKYLKPLLKQS